jgi:hypothetical protein
MKRHAAGNARYGSKRLNVVGHLFTSACDSLYVLGVSLRVFAKSAPQPDRYPERDGRYT